MKEDVILSNLNEAAKEALTKVLNRFDTRFEKHMIEVNKLNKANQQLRYSVHALINILNDKERPRVTQALEGQVADGCEERRMTVQNNDEDDVDDNLFTQDSETMML